MSQDDFLIFGSPEIKCDEIDEVVDSLKSCWLGTGPKVARFENDFKNYKKIEHSIAVNSCTAALHLSMLGLGLGPGDEVITTALTFCATVNSIIHSGATPVLADVDSETMNISIEDIKRKITPNTKAIVPVHFAGRPCEMDQIKEICKKNELFIVEDCAHAIEAEYKGRKTGTFGDIGCFSFYVTKNIVTGEGGMVITDKKEIAQRIKILSLHGMSSDAWRRFSDDGYKHYLVTEAGFKYNMMDLQAAIGIHQLSRIENSWYKRKSVWEYYNQHLKGLPIKLPSNIPDYVKHAYHLYTIQIGEEANISRDEFLVEMNKRKIGVGVHYLSIPEHPYYQTAFSWKPEDFPNALEIGRQTISLPISSKLTEEDLKRVVIAVKEILKC